MANSSGSSDSLRLLSISPPLQISPAARDARGSGNPIPLSPQWLFPKAGENKLGAGSGEGHNSQAIAFGTRQEPVKFSGAGEETDFQKKDVFRPSLLDGESGRRDRWRDEERDTVSSVRRDRWRDGDKEHGEGWVERWSVNHSSSRNHEGNRAQHERWGDQTHREASYDQRRESKWNTRWGPDSKEGDVPRDKVIFSNKDVDLSAEKLPSVLATGKDEKDGDVYRPWRLNSSQSRGRVDSGFLQNPSSNKQAAAFGYSRGRGDTSTFTVGRGRSRIVSSTVKGTPTNQAVGIVVEKSENYPYKYGRAKFLFVYRQTDMKLLHEFVDDFTQVPSITVEEPLDPLALCAPNLEESDALDGIEKGDIVSSGASQHPKDGFHGKNSSDIPHQTRLVMGGKEDAIYSLEDTKEEIFDNSKKLSDAYSLASEKNNASVGSPGSIVGRGDIEGPRGFSNLKESQNMSLGLGSVVSGTQWLPSLGQERALNTPLDIPRIPADQIPRSSFIGWNNPQKDIENRWNTNAPKHSISNEEISWKSNDVDSLKRQIGVTMEREENTFPLPPPENLVLYYKDPQGEIQGPFTGSDIIGWFEAGYFGIDLQVRLANAPNEIPFAALGDVMPHLRAKAKPPPGFNTQKQIDMVDSLGRQVYGGSHSLPSGVKDAEFALKNLKQQTISSSTEAENKFLESLMSGGVHGFSGPLSGNFSTPCEYVNDAHLMAKQMSLEKQTPLVNPYTYWSGRDSIPTVSQPDVPSDHSLLHNKFLASSESLLQHSPGVSVAGNWPRVQGDVDPFQIQHLPKSPFQNPTGMLNVRGDASSVLTPEKLISSGLPQDPQILSLLQQQYLLQLQSQAPQAQHMSPIDKLLLLKQHQQKQEEQMHLLRQQHHQHQMLSQGLPEQQMFSEGPYRQLPTSGFGIVNQYLDPPRGLMPNELFPIESNLAQGKTQDSVPQSIPLNPSFAGDTLSSLHYHHQGEVNRFSTLEQVDKITPTETLLANPYIGSNHNLPGANPPIPEDKELPSVVFTKPEVLDSSSAISSNDNDESVNCAVKLNVDEPFNLSPSDVADCTGETAVDGSSNAFEQMAITGVKAKKSQEKRSKKSKSLKISTSSDTTRSLPKVDVQEPSSLRDEANKSHRISDDASDQANESYFAVSSLDSHQVKKSFDNARSEKVFSEKDESKVVDASQHSHKAWNPAPGFKAKSIVEIQLEEQLKTKSESTFTEISPSLTSIPMNPWAGIVSTSETKQPPIIESSSINPSIPAAKKSQLHDLFAKEEALKQHDSDDDNNNFIDPKESKRGKRKGAKAKKPTSSSSVEVVEKSKSSISNKPEKEVLPAIPSGPSLGDFVVWKGEQPTNHTPLAWTSEAKKIPKPTSLRDIQKEQEKVTRVQPSVHIPIPKQQPTTQVPRTSWPSASPPTNASPSKPKLDDDLFWGPSNQTKESKNRSEFPDLGSKTTQKNTTANRPKVASVKATDDSSLKNKRDNGSKYSEAMDFRNWCEKECVRLIGSKDTSFLEFCLTQSRSEAELFLKENLGSYDPDHEFIEKFLNYKDMLPAGVLEMAFQNRSHEYVAEAEDSSVKTVGAKKKGKKGKKVSPSALGFNVVSNRIMMGEIQTVDD